MKETAESHDGDAAPSGGGGIDQAPEAIEWTDNNGRLWQIELQPQRIMLRSGADQIAVGAGEWSRDVYVARHGDGFVIRIDTFDVTVGFLVSQRDATVFLQHVGRAPVASPVQGKSTDVPEESPGGTPEESPGESSLPTAPAAPHAQAGSPRPTPLLWPKVSPLAVWALICSALVFLPLVGVVPAIATTALLMLHQKKVRRVRAWDHSRHLCLAAFLFMTVGLVVSGLSARGFAQNAPRWINSEPFGVSREPTPLSPPLLSGEGRPKHATHVVAQSEPFWEREHNWGLIAAALLIVLMSLTVHESAHAVSAWWLGDDYARRLGRVSLNPLVHIDPIGTVIIPLFLVLAGAGVFGWAKPVPVRLDNVREPRRAHILIALAGPGSNLLLAAASMLLLLGLGCSVSLLVPDATVSSFASLNITTTVTASGFALAPIFGAACTILKLSLLINVFLAFFNLIPIPPLDGSWVLEHLFPHTLGRLYDRIRPFGFLVFLGLIYSGILTYLLYPVALVLAPVFFLLGVCTGF